MRKIKIFALTFCLAVLFLFCAHAAQAEVRIASVQAKAGEQVNISVTMDNPVDVKSMYFAVECDNKQLLPTAGTWQTQGTMLKEWDKQTADGVVAFSKTTAVQGEILQLTIQIPEDLPGGAYVLSGICTVQNADSDPVTLQVASGTIRVEGEMNDDVTTTKPHTRPESTAAEVTAASEVRPTGETQAAVTSVPLSVQTELSVQSSPSETIVQVESASGVQSYEEMQAEEQSVSPGDAATESETGSVGDESRQPTESVEKVQNEGTKKPMIIIGALAVLILAALAFVLIGKKRNK